MSFKSSAGEKPRGFPRRWPIKEDSPSGCSISECTRCRSEILGKICCHSPCIQWETMKAHWEQNEKQWHERPCRFCPQPCAKAITEGWF